MNVKTIQQLKQIRSSGQIMRTDAVLTLLSNYGFETRRSKSGTSHIRIFHPDYPEIKPFNIVSGTKNRRSQQDAIDACIQNIELSSTIEIDTFEPVSENVIKPENKESVFIAEQFELIQGRKNPHLFLRHKQFPQIATQAFTPMTQEGIDQQIDYLLERVEKFESVLQKATEKSEFEIEKNPNGRMLLIHPHYPVMGVLNPFTPRLENYSVISEVQKLIDSVEALNEDYSNTMESYISNLLIKEIEATAPNTRLFLYKRRFDRMEDAYVTLETTPNGFLSYAGFVSFLQQINDIRWDNFKRNMKHNYGFDVHQTEENTIEGSHSILGESFKISSPMKKSEYHEDVERYNEATLKERKKIDALISKRFKKGEEDFTTVGDVVFKSQNKARELSQELIDLNKIYSIEVKNGSKLGEVTQATYRIGTYKVLIPVMPLKGKKPTEPRILPTPEALTILKEHFRKLTPPALEKPSLLQPNTTDPILQRIGPKII